MLRDRTLVLEKLVHFGCQLLSALSSESLVANTTQQAVATNNETNVAGHANLLIEIFNAYSQIDYSFEHNLLSDQIWKHYLWAFYEITGLIDGFTKKQGLSDLHHSLI